MQCGITLAFGKHKGRLIMPARVMGPTSSNANEWRPYHYSTALYSDDGGAVWQTSKPFPVLGTGEAALSDGSILYNSRACARRTQRFGQIQVPARPGHRGSQRGAFRRVV